MLAILFFSHFLLAFLLILSSVKGKSDPISSACVITLLYHAGLVFAGTELLSLFNLLTPLFITIFWVLMCLGLLYRFSSIKQGYNMLINTQLSFRKNRLGYSYFLAILLPLLFSAIWFAPNNGDGMRYHLLRIEHWLWNKNVDFFPTNDIRNLSFNPMAEYLMMHLRALSGSDTLVQLVQWGAFTGILAAVYLVTGILKLKERARKLAVLSTGTTAMLLLEATTSQNDLVAAFFIVVCLWAGLKLYLEGFTKNRMIVFMVALGLGAATKLNVPMALFVPCLLLIPSLFTQKWFQKKCFWIAIPLSFIFLLPGFYRNFESFNHPIQPSGQHFLNKGVGNEAFSLPAIIGNLLKHTGNLIAIPYANGFNDAYKQMVHKYHEKLKLNIEDPKYNYARNKDGFIFPFDCSFKMSEDASSAAPTLIIFMMASLTALRFSHRSREARYVSVIVLIILSTIIMVAIFIKYSPWTARHLIPALILANIPIGWWLNRCCNFHKTLYFSVSLLLILSAMRPVFFNPYKRLLDDPLTSEKSHLMLPRNQHYFIGWPKAYDSYKALTATLQKQSMPIPTFFTETATQYPLIVMLRQQKKNASFETIGFHKDLLHTAGNQPVSTQRNFILTDVTLSNLPVTMEAIKTIDTFDHIVLIGLAKPIQGYFLFDQNLNSIKLGDLHQVQVEK